MKKYIFNKYTIGAIFLVSLLAFIDWLIFSRIHIDDLQLATQKIIQQVVDLQNKSKSNETAVDENLAGSVSATTEVKNSSPQESNLVEFQNWLLTEQNEMNHFNVNETEKQQQLLLVALKLTKDQMKYLSDRLQNRMTPIREKILAAYLLSQASAEAFSEILQAIVSPIILDSEPRVHTAAEVQQTQERSLKILLINKAAEIAKNSPAALEDFKLSINQIKDIFLKKYAEQKLKEISGVS